MMDCRVETGTLRLGNARMKGTKPGDTPSKDGEAQNILQKKRGQVRVTDWVLKVWVEHAALGSPLHFLTEGRKMTEMVFLYFLHSSKMSMARTPSLQVSTELMLWPSVFLGKVLSCPLQSGARGQAQATPL